MITADVTAELGRVTAPTLVMTGAEDVLTPLDQGPTGTGARAMAELIPNARLEIVDGGHGYLVEQPEESIRIVLEFFLE